MFNIFIITCVIIGIIGGIGNICADRVGLGIFGLSCAFIALAMFIYQKGLK